jgi:hypothetical protein
MKKLLLLVFILGAHLGRAQNWQCLQPGVKRYFTNSNGYLRGIRIDSVKTYADSVVYYPFHTPRGAYDTMSLFMPLLDSSGGSWLGKKVKKISNGIFVFDSYWGDSVIIKTQAAPGDSWIFYSDAGSLFYRADVIGLDTMTVLGVLDSVKTIMITARNSSGIVTGDPVDSFRIILSKNEGFVQVFDLYTFPYHKPDSSFRSGLDFFLDRSSTVVAWMINSSGGNPPGIDVTLFRLTNFINPNQQQLGNWNVGDVFESCHSGGGLRVYTSYYLDTIVNKSISGHLINYFYSGLEYDAYYPFRLTGTSGSFTLSDAVYPVIDTDLMPEEKYIAHYACYYFYFPGDTSHCMNTPAYKKIPIFYSNGMGAVTEDTVYKYGVGQVHYYHYDGDPWILQNDLFYYVQSGLGCGSARLFDTTTHHDTTSSINAPRENNYHTLLFPNPTTNELTISTTILQPYTITLINTFGQTVKTILATKQEQTINTTNIPAGVYTISITDESGNRYNEKVIIVH